MNEELLASLEIICLQGLVSQLVTDVCHLAFVALSSALRGFSCTQPERAPEIYWTSLARSLGRELLLQLVSGESKGK